MLVISKRLEGDGHMMLKHKKNCKENLVTIQHRRLDGDNGSARTVHRLYCPNCKNNCAISFEEAQKWVLDHPVGRNFIRVTPETQ